MAGKILVSSVIDIRPRKFYNATFIAHALSQGHQMVAEYCGKSIALIEKHYGRYIKNDSEEQLKKLFEGKPETFTETPRHGSDAETPQV